MAIFKINSMLKLINDLKRHNGPLMPALEEAVVRVLRSGWFILGSEVESFEREFANYCGVDFCIGVANGTEALELALRALEIGPGDEVATVANAGMYSTTAILAAGAQPVFADIDPDTLLLSATTLQNAVTTNTKAVIVTHLYGRMADMPALSAFAKRSGIHLIEDCAQAHGASLADKKAGSWGELACFSFYPTKNLGALGDGGAVVTVSVTLYERLRQLRQYGWASKYCAVVTGGRNSRLDEIQAAILRVKLPWLDGWNQRRREIAKAYSKGIQHPDIRCLSVPDEGYVGHLYILRTAKRELLRRYLQEQGIATDIHYPIPDHRQPALKARYNHITLPHTESATTEVITLPCFPEMTETETNELITTINAWRP